MRKLHPVGVHEALQASGTYRRADGGEERWSRHGLPGGRRVIRVEVLPGGEAVAGQATAVDELWHLMLDEADLPERLEVRLHEGAEVLDATYTFFADEVLVWRRGGEPASEAVAVPPGYRLLWPPIAGRERCLAGQAPGGGPDAVMTFSIARRPAADGWLRHRPIKFTVRTTPTTIALATPGLRDQQGELDESGELRRWLDGVRVAEREPLPGMPPPGVPDATAADSTRPVNVDPPPAG